MRTVRCSYRLLGGVVCPGGVCLGGGLPGEGGLSGGCTPPREQNDGQV